MRCGKSIQERSHKMEHSTSRKVGLFTDRWEGSQPVGRSILPPPVRLASLLIVIPLAFRVEAHVAKISQRQMIAQAADMFHHKPVREPAIRSGIEGSS